MENLQKIIKAFKSKPISVNIGILEDGNARSDGQSNATIGAAHEFGTSTIPMRSFLRVPLTENLAPALESSRDFSEDTLKAVVKGVSLKPWGEIIGETGKDIVLEAFDTNGFGRWPKDKIPQGQTLVKTGQLKGSISYDVKEG